MYVKSRISFAGFFLFSHHKHIDNLETVIYFFVAECHCNFDGTRGDSICDTKTGRCHCKPNWTGSKCESAGKPHSN